MSENSVEKYGVKAKYKEYGKIMDGPMVLGTRPMAYFEANPFREPEKMKPGPTYVPPKEKVAPQIGGHFIPTGPGKWLGGCKDGCFDKFPEHKSNRGKKEKVDKTARQGVSSFAPPAYGDRSLYTCSVINENITFRVNSVTYKDFQPNYIKHLL